MWARSPLVLEHPYLFRYYDLPYVADGFPSYCKVTGDRQEKNEIHTRHSFRTHLVNEIMIQI